MGVDRPYAELFPPANASLLRALYPHMLLHRQAPARPDGAPAAASAPHPDHAARPHAAPTAATAAHDARRRGAARHAASGAAHATRGREQALSSRASEKDHVSGPARAGPHRDEARTPGAETGRGRGREIDALERDMARSLRTLNARLDKLDDAPRSAASARRAAWAGPAMAAMAAVMAASAAWRLA
jgi:hypothetical protein